MAYVFGLSVSAFAVSAAARARLWLRPVASLVVPGAGQLLAKQDRGLIYLATEAFVLSRFLQLTHDAHRSASRYRDLAYAVARRGFTVVRRDTVFDILGTRVPERVVAVGRLDLNSEGLLILTDDGDLVQKLTHPSGGCRKEYEVKVSGVPTPAQLERLRRGIVLDDGKRTAPAEIELQETTPEKHGATRYSSTASVFARSAAGSAASTAFASDAKISSPFACE